MNEAQTRRLTLPIVLRGKRLFAVSLNLAVHQTGLADVLAGRARDLVAQPLPAGLDGQLLCGVVDQGWRTYSVLDDRLAYVVRRDVWHYLAWPGSYESFLEGRYSAKTRESFARDEQRFAESFGVDGALDVRVYRSPVEIDTFLQLVQPIRSIQVPVAMLRSAAEAGRLHGLVLFARGAPAAFVCLQAQGDTLQYVGAGEHADFRQWSAGTLIHLAAFRRLFADERFRFVDFRPGENEVKRQFSNGSLRSAVVLQLQRTLYNRLVLSTSALQVKSDNGETAVSSAAVNDEIQTLLGELA